MYLPVLQELSNLFEATGKGEFTALFVALPIPIASSAFVKTLQ